MSTHAKPSNRAELDVHVEKALILVRGSVKDQWLLRALIPTLVGLMVLSRHDIWPGLLEVEGHWAEIITHLGIAFVVSGIVVFGYEWGSDHKKTAALTASLLNLLGEHASRVLRASDRDAVKNALSNLAGTDGDSYAKHFLSLADSIARLGRGGWTSRSHLRFLEHYLKELTEKATGLADVSEKLQGDASVSGSEYHLLMPDAPRLVDVLVEATMQELSERGGDYYAVSDASTWDRLGAFSKAHLKSLGRVHARRVFVLGRDSDQALPPTRINDILAEHFRQSRKRENRYEMKITTQDEYRRMRVPGLSDAVHFGIWFPTNRTPIAVFAIDDNLTNFRLSPVPSETIHAFMAIWNRLNDLSDAPLGRNSKTTIGEAEFQDHMLAYRVKRMSQGAHYRGVSMMGMWCDGGLKRFFDASVDAVNTREVWVKRIFVFDAPESATNRRILDVLREHATFAARTTRYDWRICLRSELPDELNPPGVAMFEGVREDDGQVLSEVAVGPAGPNSPLQVESQPRTFASRVRAFDDFWDTLETEASVPTIFGSDAQKVFEILRRVDSEL